jgi:hypothetical protein
MAAEKQMQVPLRPAANAAVSLGVNAGLRLGH